MGDEDGAFVAFLRRGLWELRALMLEILVLRDVAAATAAGAAASVSAVVGLAFLVVLVPFWASQAHITSCDHPNISYVSV